MKLRKKPVNFISNKDALQISYYGLIELKAKFTNVKITDRLLDVYSYHGCKHESGFSNIEVEIKVNHTIIFEQKFPKEMVAIMDKNFGKVIR